MHRPARATRAVIPLVSSKSKLSRLRVCVNQNSSEWKILVIVGVIIRESEEYLHVIP